MALFFKPIKHKSSHHSEKVSTTHSTVQKDNYCPVYDWPLDKSNDTKVKTKIAKNAFEIAFDCTQFQPEEIKVTIKKDKLHILCNHKQIKNKHDANIKLDRMYNIPKSVDRKSLKQQLSQDGELIVTGTLIQSE
uniref:SHSP domain-containing protein n=1 Tax=Rhabditophanes sp. KR3021 TaxID=114890 RepID=A0AC35TN73_9BILA